MSISPFLRFSNVFKNRLIKNSTLGILSNIMQNIFFSIFFVVVARFYSEKDFANYIISNTICSFILGFSTLGLGNWFIRELKSVENRELLISKFIKIQFILGFIFYSMNVIIAYSLYRSYEIRIMSLLFGVYIITDNLIYVIKSIGIADLRQEKAYMFTTLESLFKFLIACLLFFIPVSMYNLIALLILARLLIFYLFIKFGNENVISIKTIFKSNSDFKELLKIVKSNWSFVVIATIAVLNWRIGNIFVSKYLTIKDVGFYEVAFKLLSIAYIIPVVVSTSVYPFLIEIVRDKDLMKYYPSILWIFNFYGFFTFTLIYSFSDHIIPFLFGKQFSIASIYCKQMFTVMLFFPSVLLQANLMIANKKEKADMYCNLSSLILNVLICLFFLPYFKSISVVIFAIVSSFAFFHLIQDFILIKYKIISGIHTINNYVVVSICLISYYLLSMIANDWVAFSLFWTIFLFVLLMILNSKEYGFKLKDNFNLFFIKNEIKK